MTLARAGASHSLDGTYGEVSYVGILILSASLSNPFGIAAASALRPRSLSWRRGQATSRVPGKPVQVLSGLLGSSDYRYNVPDYLALQQPPSCTQARRGCYSRARFPAHSGHPVWLAGSGHGGPREQMNEYAILSINARKHSFRFPLLPHRVGAEVTGAVEPSPARLRSLAGQHGQASAPCPPKLQLSGDAARVGLGDPWPQRRHVPPAPAPGT